MDCYETNVANLQDQEIANLDLKRNWLCLLRIFRSDSGSYFISPEPSDKGDIGHWYTLWAYIAWETQIAII